MNELLNTQRAPIMMTDETPRTSPSTKQLLIRALSLFAKTNTQLLTQMDTEPDKFELIDTLMEAQEKMFEAINSGERSKHKPFRYARIVETAGNAQPDSCTLENAEGYDVVVV